MIRKPVPLVKFKIDWQLKKMSIGQGEGCIGVGFVRRSKGLLMVELREKERKTTK